MHATELANSNVLGDEPHACDVFDLTRPANACFEHPFRGERHLPWFVRHRPDSVLVIGVVVIRSCRGLTE